MYRDKYIVAVADLETQLEVPKQYRLVIQSTKRGIELARQRLNRLKTSKRKQARYVVSRNRADRSSGWHIVAPGECEPLA